MYDSPAKRLELAKKYLEERKNRNPLLTPSRTFVNSTTTGLYTGNNMGGAREGDDQHRNKLRRLEGA